MVLSGIAAVVLLSTSLAAIGLDDGGGPYHFTSQRGTLVELYGGYGPYRYDSVDKAVLFRGFDWANLVVSLPVLILGTILSWRGRLHGQLLVAAAFAYLAYNYLIGVMGNAYNALFLAWTALFSIGLFGLGITLARTDLPALPKRLAVGFPRRSLSAYLVTLAAFLLVQYLTEIIAAYHRGEPPDSLGAYTTLELAALELGIMIPLHLATAILLWRRRAAGYLAAIVLTFTAQMTFISLSVAGLILHFGLGRGGGTEISVPAVLAVVATGFSAVIYRRMSTGDSSGT